MKDEKTEFDKFIEADRNIEEEIHLNPNRYIQGDFDMELAKQISSVGWWSNRWTNMSDHEEKD
ncbi:hypothetical protein [Fuchsiella alkaliacetigena]|uniref:hypothetical protein n=1 Tax=Fuchsiella alkaliacetigena TaxID=957042 RepID=UPI00200B7BB2|nr:hypothetical protein [Fuchsiella alkaliacetigena]MCK8824907.1 hypothetical protein [Fuchsiella alkaliacetigena]